MNEEQIKTEENKFRLRTILIDEDVMFLREKCEPVQFANVNDVLTLDPETKELIQELKKYILENNGLGMAANQLGVKKRIFVMRQHNTNNLIVVINPKIMRAFGKGVKSEACFSIPMSDGVVALVQRPNQVFVRYTDENGITVEEDLFGIQSRVFQHEYDHLEGILAIDSAGFKGLRREY